MTTEHTDLSIDEYLRERLMPVEGAIPHIPGIEMYGKAVPVGRVGGDLFEYINFQQRYDVDARIQQALKSSKEFLNPLPPGAAPRNSVDDHVEWLRSRPDHKSEMEAEYRDARSSEQVRIAEALHELFSTAGVLLVDAQGHGLIAAKIASTVHDTFHRPGKGQHNALDALYTGLLTRKVNWVLDGDVSAFFDGLDHEWLIKFIEHRVADQRVVRLIRKWLNAGVLEEGQWTCSDEGTPQGGSASPLLANLYLHYVFDLWVQHWRKTKAKGDVLETLLLRD